MLSIVFDVFYIIAIFFLLMPVVTIALAVAGMLFKNIRGDYIEHPMHLATREFYEEKPLEARPSEYTRCSVTVAS